MLKRVRIKTMLVSQTENGEDRITSEASGGCLVDTTGVMLRYSEKENDGTASLVLADGLASLRRKGHITSQMTFVEGKLLPCPYTTEAGSFDLSLYTHSQQFTVVADGGRFRARYTLLAAGQQVADNELTVEWNFL